MFLSVLIYCTYLAGNILAQSPPNIVDTNYGKVAIIIANFYSIYASWYNIFHFNIQVEGLVTDKARVSCSKV